MHQSEDRLIGQHLNWLRPRIRTATDPDRDPPTLVKRRRLLRHADEHLPWGVEQADPAEIAAYLSAWTGWSRYTYDTHLRSFYRWALAAGYVTVDPMAGIPKPARGPEETILPADGELALALCARAPFDRAILLACRAGLRCGEIARAHRRQLLGNRLRVLGKGGKVRMVPLDDLVLAAIAGETGWLLGRQVRAEWLTGNQRHAWRALGLPETFHLHSGRHWCATQLLRHGATIRQVQVFLGHSSVMTTQRYTHVVDDEIAEAVLRLPRITAEPGSNGLDGLRAA